MKNLKPIILLTCLLIVMGGSGVMAQRAEKTSSARAYYGNPVKKSKHKIARQRVRNFHHTKPARGTRADATTRRKYS